METEAMQKMMRCRSALIRNQRFFGSLALKLNLLEDPTAETMWTDGVSLGFNPDWTLSLTMDETKGVICHEVMHCSAGHHVRRNGRDPLIWNQAADYAINRIILDAGLTLPAGMLVSDEFNEMSADNIFSVLFGRQPQPEEQQEGEQGQGQGEQQQQQPQGNEESEQQENGNGQGQGQGETNGQGEGEQQPAHGDPGGCGEIRDYTENGNPATETEKQQQAQEWQIATQSAANFAEGCGQMTGGLKQIVKEMVEPKVPWRETLQRFVEQVSHNDYSYARTNARYAAHGLIMPSLYNKTLPPIDIWVDTSGSCFSPDEQMEFISEINDIRNKFATTIRIVYCDEQVQDVEIVEAQDVLTDFAVKGGGGTRFSPAIEWSMKQDDPPCCGIYLTDMDCDDFGPEPEFPVLWIQNKHRKAEPPFGEVVLMNPRNY